MYSGDIRKQSLQQQQTIGFAFLRPVAAIWALN
jgi:hypothetical protein